MQQVSESPYRLVKRVHSVTIHVYRVQECMYKVAECEYSVSGRKYKVSVRMHKVIHHLYSKFPSPSYPTQLFINTINPIT
jgi:hypothetical protein